MSAKRLENKHYFLIAHFLIKNVKNTSIIYKNIIIETFLKKV